MSNSQWSADQELLIACKVGSLSGVTSALEEGANINAEGGTPLFTAIMNRQPEMIDVLVRAGVDVTMFLTTAQLKKLKTPESIIDELVANCPPPPAEDEEPPADDEVAEAKQHSTPKKAKRKGRPKGSKNKKKPGVKKAATRKKSAS